MVKNLPYLFAKKDVIDQFADDKQFENHMASMVRSGKIVKIRNGLYAQIDNLGVPLTTKFEIASKINDESFVSHHSALEYYGVANQVFNTLTVGSKRKFNDFSFDDVDYTRQAVKDYTQVIYIVTAGVRIATLERAVVDCIDNIDLGGGIDELLNALEQIRVLDENKLAEILQAYNKVILYQKVGFILEQYKDRYMLSDKFFADCKSRLTNQIKYFLNDEYSDIAYNSDWQLMAPKNLKSRISGGF
ncbi:MAG: hypothetical protein J6Y43_08560 [Clostridia bacterium]|nr:hypothetical protein [Clostridia bacterium]